MEKIRHFLPRASGLLKIVQEYSYFRKTADFNQRIEEKERRFETKRRELEDKVNRRDDKIHQLEIELKILKSSASKEKDCSASG